MLCRRLQREGMVYRKDNISKIEMSDINDIEATGKLTDVFFFLKISYTSKWFCIPNNILSFYCAVNRTCNFRLDISR